MLIEKRVISGDELSKLASQRVSDEHYKQICKNLVFKEFVKIFTFMQINIKAGTDHGFFDTQYFRHTFQSYNEKKEIVNIDVDIKMTPTIITKQ